MVKRNNKEPGMNLEWWFELKMDEIELLEVDEIQNSFLAAVD